MLYTHVIYPYLIVYLICISYFIYLYLILLFPLYYVLFFCMWVIYRIPFIIVIMGIYVFFYFMFVFGDKDRDYIIIDLCDIVIFRILCYPFLFCLLVWGSMIISRILLWDILFIYYFYDDFYFVYH